MATKKIMRDAARGDLWRVDPWQVRIVGLDKDAPGKDHPLYDERVKMALDPNMVKNVAVYGVLEPVTVTKDGEQYLVVDGRQRTRACREANKQLAAAGEAELRLPVQVRRDDARGLQGVMIASNEVRYADSYLVKGRKALKLSNQGWTEAEIAVAFSVSRPMIRNYMAYAGMAPIVHKAVEAGQLTASAALLALGDLSHDEQARKLPAVLKAKPTKRQAAKKKADKKKDSGGAPRMRNRREIEARLDEAKLPRDYKAALRWVLRLDE